MARDTTRVHVSILAATSTAGTLLATVSSLQRQTLTDWKAIVHAPGTDALPLVKSVCEKDARVTWSDTPVVSPSSAPFHVTLDAGDMLEPDALNGLAERGEWYAGSSAAPPGKPRFDPDKFAVVIPAYNSEAWVGRTIRSAMKQTIKGVHIVVVDDCSTDATKAKAQKALGKYAKGQLVACPENVGVSQARNLGWHALPNSVEFVCFVDADDVLLPDALEVLADRLNQSPNAPAAAGLAIPIDARGHLTPRPTWFPKWLPPTVGADSFRDQWPFVTPGTQLWRRSALDILDGWPDTLQGADGEPLRGEDVIICAEAAKVIAPIVCTSVPVLLKREHEASYCGSDPARLRRASAAAQIAVFNLLGPKVFD